MLAYASPHPFAARRRVSPTGLALIALAHALAIGALITARTAIKHAHADPTDVIFLPDPPKPPEPRPVEPSSDSKTVDPVFTPDTKVDTPLAPRDPVVTSTTPADPGPLVTDPGTSLDPPLPPFTPAPPVHKAAVFATPRSELDPPYPPSKLDAGEEMRLDLSLEVNAEGRVISVSPIGRSDPVFFAAARRHILAHWRYKPASDDGRPVASHVRGFVDFRILE